MILLKRIIRKENRVFSNKKNILMKKNKKLNKKNKILIGFVQIVKIITITLDSCVTVVMLIEIKFECGLLSF